MCYALNNSLFHLSSSPALNKFFFRFLLFAFYVQFVQHYSLQSAFLCASKIKGVINAQGVRTASTPPDPFALIFRKQMRDIGSSAARFTASGGTRALIANVRLQPN